MFWFCLTLVIIAVVLYNSYYHSVIIMASRLNLPFSYNQKNVTWSELPIVDKFSIIWICVSDQLQLIRFHVVFYKYHITFLAVFQWSIPGLIMYLPSFSIIYAMSGQVQTWAYIRLSTADVYERNLKLLLQSFSLAPLSSYSLFFSRFLGELCRRKWAGI